MTVYALGEIRPTLGDGVWVAPSAAVIGNVRLGADVGVWFGAVIRGDNEPIVVEAGTNIQDNCVLHSDAGFPLAIGEGCTVGHRAIVHGCTIGNNVLVGMGATILNGAQIGENCLIGAGALVPEGKIIPPGSLVIGMPGKVVRPLTPEQIEGLRESARHYVHNKSRFAAGLAESDKPLI